MALPSTLAHRFWRVANPVALPLGGWMPFWVLLETTGHRSGRRRLTPLASGRRFNFYARSARSLVGVDPLLVRVRFTP